jgi:hypothetical protein
MVAVGQESLQHPARIGPAVLIAMEGGHAGYETDQDQATPEENAKDEGSLPAERGEDSDPFCGQHADT